MTRVLMPDLAYSSSVAFIFSTAAALSGPKKPGCIQTPRTGIVRDGPDAPAEQAGANGRSKPRTNSDRMASDRSLIGKPPWSVLFVPGGGHARLRPAFRPGGRRRVPA